MSLIDASHTTLDLGKVSSDVLDGLRNEKGIDGGEDGVTTFTRSLLALLEKDLKNIEDGYYKFPYDMDIRDPRCHQQWNPISMATKYQKNQLYIRKFIKLLNDDRAEEIFGKEFYSEKYPDYFLTVYRVEIYVLILIKCRLSTTRREGIFRQIAQHSMITKWRRLS